MKTLASVVFAALLVAGPASAGVHPWAAISGSWNTYAMDDVNRGIESLNALIAPSSLDAIESGIGFGAAAGVDVGGFSAGLAYERLPASSDVRGFMQAFAYDLPAKAFVGRVVYRIPGRLGLGIGLGGGIVVATGEIGNAENAAFARSGPARTTAQILGPRVQVSGHGPCLEAFVQKRFAVVDGVAVVPSVGYRRARIDGTLEGSEGKADGTFDYSGLALRVALRVGGD
jgi:hypothetical protein